MSFLDNVLLEKIEKEKAELEMLNKRFENWLATQMANDDKTKVYGR